jgi:hypothetical protein
MPLRHSAVTHDPTPLRSVSMDTTSGGDKEISTLLMSTAGIIAGSR